ncbi:tRNA lysidine(34) synthetase TilS, partial [Conexibacter sp. CPCC 205706]|uniref:tRNA lysidine(34) synthetase TilS n=1 Tax=Conexibacter sp. CPCC 205706 TaxID=3064572 RepID=UPI0027162191
MNPDDVVEQVRAGGLLRTGEAVVVLLSGGRDSVCLLDVAARIAGPAHVGAVHVNYGLRAEAGADADHCRALCAELGVALTVEQAMPRAGGNMQAWARELRYAAAARAAARRGPATAIAVGHTADDQVETILYRLASSPSRRALLGMRARDGALVRPLLQLTRAQTTAYCEARGLAWRDDASNDGRAYARNRIRHDLVAALREAHPAAEANVLRIAAVLGEEAELLDALVDEQLDAPGGRTIPLQRLRGLAPALRRLVVQRLADDAAGRPVAGAAGHAGAVAALRERGTAYADLGGGVRAVAEYGVVRAGLVARGPRGGALPAAGGPARSG